MGEGCIYEKEAEKARWRNVRNVMRFGETKKKKFRVTPRRRRHRKFSITPNE